MEACNTGIVSNESGDGTLPGGVRPPRFVDKGLTATAARSGKYLASDLTATAARSGQPRLIDAPPPRGMGAR